MKRYVSVLVVIGVLVGGMAIFKHINNIEDPSLVSKEIPNEEKKNDEILPVEHINENIKNNTLRTAEQFLNAYINYSAKNPIAYVQKIKPFVTEEFFIKHAQHPKREPLDVASYKWDPKKAKLSFAELIDTKKVEYLDTITIFAEVVRVETSKENKTFKEPMEYWLEFTDVQDNWLISEVNIQNGKQYSE